MNINQLIVVITEPRSVFLEIFFKYVKSIKNKIHNKRITLIGNFNIIEREAKKNNFKNKFNRISNIDDALEKK